MSFNGARRQEGMAPEHGRALRVVRWISIFLIHLNGLLIPKNWGLMADGYCSRTL
jgi:hypothetical protein